MRLELDIVDGLTDDVKSRITEAGGTVYHYEHAYVGGENPCVWVDVPDRATAQRVVEALYGDEHDGVDTYLLGWR